MASNNSGSSRMFARPTHSDAKAYVLSSYTILGITTHVKVRCKSIEGLFHLCPWVIRKP